MSPSILNVIGGIRTIIFVFTLGLVFARYQQGDSPFLVAVSRGIQANRGLFFLLIWYFFGVLFSGIRGGMGSLGEWKLHGFSILGLLVGLFLLGNDKFTRFAVYAAGLTMLIHSISANNYVSVTGFDMREALADLSGLLGHTDYWTKFSMITILLVGQLVGEKNKIIKYVGLVIIIYFYKTILLCGFATPVALFIIAHVFLGWVGLKFSGKGFSKIFVRSSIALALFVGSVWGIYQISYLENVSEYSSIQKRFKNMLEDPQGGGYSRENSRFSLAEISLKTFKESPFLGCGGPYLDNEGSGGHQSIFDYLAIYGIFGGGGAFICFVVLCLYNGYKRCRNERDWKAFSSFASVSIFVMVGLVNPGWLGGALYTCLFYGQPFKRPPRSQQLSLVKGNTPRSAFSLPLPYSPVTSSISIQ